MITIDYDPKLDKFEIGCPFWANDALQDMPSKSWSKARKKWLAPASRANCAYIMQKIAPMQSTISKESTERMAFAEKKRTPDPVIGFPSWFKYKNNPRPHQVKGLNKAYGKKAFALHADRGTGKTFMAISLAAAYRMEGHIDSLLVICKISLRRNWDDEIAEHCPIPASVFLPNTSDAKVREYKRWLGQHDFPVLVVGTESLSAGNMIKIASHFIRSHSKPMVLIDESHMICNPKVTRTKNCYDLGRPAHRRLTLTGTPISTGPMDLFSQFEFLDTDIIGIGDFYAFRNRYAIMGGYRDPKTKQPMEIVGYKNLEELTKLVAPYVYEISKAEALPHLPPKSFKKYHIDLTKKQKDLYAQIKKDEAYTWKGKEVVVQNVLGLALRLHQVAGGFIATYREEETVKRDGTPKIVRHTEWHEIIPPEQNPKMIELLDIVTSNPVPTIIWCAYRPEIEAVCKLLRKAFPGQLVREIHGGITEDERAQYKDEFQSGKCKWLVGNTATGGTGLTLTAAEQMIYYNNTEKMIDREQSEDRAHRDGLRHPVLYIDLVAEATVDEVILNSIKQKMDLADYIRKAIRDGDPTGGI